MPDNRKRLDPWTFGELHPSGMSHVTLASSVPNRPGQPIRRGPRGQRGRQRSPPPPTYLGAPAGCRQMWGWLSRCLPSPLSAWLAGINGGLPRRPPPALASSLTATTTTLPRWAGLCGPRSRRRHTRPPARPDTPRSLLGLLAGTAHTGSTTRTYSTHIQPPPSEHIAKEPAIGAQQPQRCKHCLLLHHHSTRPMMQATTQSGSKRNTSQAAPRARQVKHAAKGPMGGAQPEHCTHHLLLHCHPTGLMMQATTQSGCKRRCKEQHQEIAAHAVMMRSVVGGPEAPLGAGCDDVSARAPRPGSAERGVAAASSESASRINTALIF